MYSSCLLLLNRIRKSLEPNTSVKSMNHPLFISLNRGKRGRKENCSLQMGCEVLFLLRPDEKNTKVSLSLPTHLTPYLWESVIGGEIRSGRARNQSGTPYTSAWSHASRKCPAPPLPSTLSLTLFSLMSRSSLQSSLSCRPNPLPWPTTPCHNPPPPPTLTPTRPPPGTYQP